MSERPTPETDAEHAQFAMGGFTLDFCRKLERERDEAREDLEFRRGLYKVQEEYLEEAREKAERYRLEANALMLQRDEAREALADWENAADHVEANHPDEVHCGCVPVLRKLLTDVRKELNEWQTLRLWGGTPEHIHDFIKGQQTRIHEAQDIEKTCEQLERERDEAREVLREIAEASSFDNIGNWARNKARKEIDQYRKKNDLLPISWDV